MAAPLLPSLPPAHFVERRRGYDLWLVPSDSHPDEPHRVVARHSGAIHCPCPLHMLGGKRCRHIAAVAAAMKEMTMPDAFDPNKHLIQLSGKDYLECKWRLVWLRQDHPNAIITTEILEHNAADKWAIIKATVTIPGAGSATGMALQAPTGIAKDYIANGETSAIGRALAALGYGTQHATELDQGEQVVDSPVEPRAKPAPARKPAAPPAPKPTATELSGKAEPPETPTREQRNEFRAACKQLNLTHGQVRAVVKAHTNGAVLDWETLDRQALDDLTVDLKNAFDGTISLEFAEDGAASFTYPPVPAEGGEIEAEGYRPA